MVEHRSRAPVGVDVRGRQNHPSCSHTPVWLSRHIYASLRRCRGHGSNGIRTKTTRTR